MSTTKNTEVQKIPQMKIISAVSDHVEDCYDDAVALGDHAAYTVGRVHRSQMTGLEGIAESTLKTSDVFDFIKKQVARFSYWRKNFPNPEHGSELGFGVRLLNYLQDELGKRRDKIASDLRRETGIEVDKLTSRRIHLQLIRQFIRKMVAQYEFRVSEVATGRRGSGDDAK